MIFVFLIFGHGDDLGIDPAIWDGFVGVEIEARGDLVPRQKRLVGLNRIQIPVDQAAHVVQTVDARGSALENATTRAVLGAIEEPTSHYSIDFAIEPFDGSFWAVSR